MRRLTLSILLVFIWTLSFSQVHEISLITKRKSEIKSSPKNSNSFSLSFSNDKIYGKKTLAKDSKNYTEIWCKGTYPNGVVGEPNLPTYKKLIRIPKGSKPTIKVVSYTQQIFNLNDNGLNASIYPNQPSVRKDQDSLSIKFYKKEKSYKFKNLGNSPEAKIEVLGNLRSATIARVVVSPVDYNPGDGSIKVYNDIDVDVSFDKSETLDTKTYSQYFESVYNSLENPLKNSYTDHPDLTKYPVKMLIISNRMFEQTLQPYIAWKKLKGFNVITAYTDVIGTTSSSIKTYIQGIYNSATESDPAPSFLVLVGDVAQVPASDAGSESEKLTDLYYASVDGDVFPDMYYGRLSASTTSELQNIIDKIIYYEKYQFSDPTYLNKATLIAGYDSNGWTTKVGQPTIKYGTANYFNSSNGYTEINEFGVPSDPNNPNSNSSYSGCYGADKIAVGIINYTAHGSVTSWADPSLTNSSISSFSNQNKYPLAIGNCCLSADFGADVCFGEAWIRAQNKGAVTYIGSSPNSYWLEDMYWAVGAFPMVGSNDGYVPTFAETTTGAYDAPFVSSYVTTGGIVFAGNLSVTEVENNNYPNESSITSKYYWEAYNILGDPSLMPYFTEAEANQVSHNLTITLGETTFNVNALGNSYIAISKDGQLLGTTFVTHTGDVSVPIASITSTGNVIITVTRPQTIPTIDTITAINPTGPFLLLTSSSIDDHLSNNNGIADYNEQFTENLSIKNIGIDDATNVSVKITGTDNYISITGNDSIGIANISHIDGSNTLNVNGAFTFNVLENVPDQHKASFTLTFYSDQGSWTSVLPITLNSPVLTIGDLAINESSPNGNGDGKFNPGETCSSTVKIINAGHSSAKNITVDINIPDSLSNIVTLNYSQITIPLLESSASADVSFTLSATSGIKTEYLIPIKIQATVVEPSGTSKVFEKTVLLSTSVNISNTTLTTCFTNFYDTGGPNGTYSNSENYTMTFTANEPSNLLKLTFTSFNTEKGFDFIYIYNGSSTSSPQIPGSPFSGTTLPSDFVSTGNSLTFRFTSDGNSTENGWAAKIECVEPQIPSCITTPNPSNGATNVQSQTLTWKPDLFATFYDVYIGNSSNGLSLKERVYKPQYSFDAIKNTTYFWQIVPGNSLGLNNSYCNVWQFSTDTICGQIAMSNNTLLVDTMYFYDSGGSLSSYSNQEDYILTLKPKYVGNKLKIDFLEYDLESCTDCSCDWLKIYDGSSTSDKFIDVYCGTTLPNSFEATNTEGALTFVFHSDVNTTGTGWKAIVRSLGSNLAPILTNNQIIVYPNPTSDQIWVKADKPIEKVTLLNSIGVSQLSTSIALANETTINLAGLTDGVYILIVYCKNSVHEKVLVIKR